MPEEVAIETTVFTRAEVTKDYPHVTTGRELVDAITTRMVLKAKTLDVLNPFIVSWVNRRPDFSRCEES
jgi:hypothetical protein